MNQAAETKTTPPQGENQGQTYSINFLATGGALFGEFLKNSFLTIITLGIYAYWAVVNYRKFFWSNTEVHGQRLSYHGTGMEMFIGYLKVAGFFVGVSLLVAGAGMIHPYLGVALAVVALGLYSFLIPYAQYSGRRYRFSRTAWRGIRFGMHNKAVDFAKLFFIEAIKTGLTLGLWLPIMKNRLYAFKMNNSYWGELAFRYTGDDKTIWKMTFVGFLLCAVTLGIYTPWLMLKLAQYKAQNTWIGSSQLGAAHANLGHSVFGFIWNVIKAELLTVFTLGIGMPWAACMFARYLLGSVTFQGNLDLDKVKAVESTGDASGDALATAFDAA